MKTNLVWTQLFFRKTKPMAFDGWCFQRGEYTRPMGFDGWFFKGGSTQNRWALMGNFSKGGVHKTNSFWNFIFCYWELSARGVYFGKYGMQKKSFEKFSGPRVRKFNVFIQWVLILDADEWITNYRGSKPQGLITRSRGLKICFPTPFDVTLQSECPVIRFGHTRTLKKLERDFSRKIQ